MANSLSFVDQLKTTRTTLVVAQASYEIWWQYAGALTRPQFLSAMNRFSDFFRYDQEAHFRVVVIHLHMLFDRSRNAVSFSSLIKLAGIPDKQKAVLNERLSSLIEPADKLKKLRDKLFAHRDRSYSYESVYAEAQIRPDDIAHILRASIQIFNCLVVAAGQSEFEPNPFVSDDTRAMLMALRPTE